MRIIGGKFGGRRFNPPAKNWPTRPTTDYAKEALFNILNNTWDFDGMKVLDLFGGSGSLTYEFISRGCNDVTYVDKFGSCISFVKQTAEKLGIEDELNIIRGDVFKFIDSTQLKFDFIFCDPPYALPRLADLPDLIFKHELLAEDGWAVVEHDMIHDFKSHEHFFDERKYGGTIFSFFRQVP